MNIVQEIAVWAKALPPWQSDAVRRIFTKQELSPDDETDLLSMLLDAHGLTEPGAIAPVPSPFTDTVELAATATSTVLLKEIHGVEGVNALVPGQSIAFSLNGLTVIFGENGTGKSGYARVFKHACHAREKSEPILPNVMSKAKARPTPTAILELLVDGKDVAIRWRSGAPVSASLAQVAVFDSHCARVFIDEANEVVYLPYGLDVFARLAKTCSALKSRILYQLRLIPPQYEYVDDYGATTVAGKFVRAMSDKTDDEGQVAALSTLDDAQTARLAHLRKVVADARANPPKQRASQLRRQKLRFQQLRTTIAGIASALSPKELSRLRDQCNAAITARGAAELASNEAFRGDPLPGTGRDPWRLLFEAAKRFSQEAAYPDHEFPVLNDGALCLWCQQPLSESAKERMLRFKRFIETATEQQRQVAQAELSAALDTLTGLKTEASDHDGTLLDELQALEPALADAVRVFFIQATDRKNAATAAVANGQWPTFADELDGLLTQFDSACSALEAQAVNYDNADKPEELATLTAAFAELEDRERLRKQSAAVKNFIREKKSEAALRQCERALDTSGITRRGSELMERAVTEQLMKNLSSELRRFGVQSVPIEIRKFGEKGATKHQLTISYAARPSGVLSEGEQRVVAIASFLAELKTGNSTSPIVFDDPVSSLDHRFREKVAARLVEEGRSRQVIIFTHDVVMLLALEREAAEQRVPLLINTVVRSTSGPGECRPPSSRPWYACSTKDRLGILKQTVAPFKKMAKDSPDVYARAVAEFYGKLREAWERAIEEILFQDAIQRFRPSIETQRLKRVTIESADYASIEPAMKKCSTWLDGHDSAAAIGTPMPDPDEVDSDLAALNEFVSLIRERAEKTGKTATALVEPPAPQISQKRAAIIVDLASASHIGPAPATATQSN